MRHAPAGVPLRVAGFLGDTDFRGRMEEMGLVPGARVCLIRPGNPLLVRIGETRLVLGGSSADRVLVDAVPEAKALPVKPPSWRSFFFAHSKV